MNETVESRGTGSVAGLFIAASPGAPMQSVERVEAVAQRGLRGDRYFAEEGTFSKTRNGERPAGRSITLIEHEALRAAHHQHSVDIAANECRRNLITRGVPLNHLIGREFTVGAVRLLGVKLCEPCGHLERLTREGVKKALIHRGGLRAEILSDGEIAVGDIIEPG